MKSNKENKKDNCALDGDWKWSCMCMSSGFGELLTQQNEITYYLLSAYCEPSTVLGILSLIFTDTLCSELYYPHLTWLASL